MAPINNFQSTIESPEPVNLVTPPTITMVKIRKQPENNHIIIEISSLLIFCINRHNKEKSSDKLQLLLQRHKARLEM